VPLPVGKYEWLLFLHLTGAFLFLGGSVVAAVLAVAALRCERPSEVATLLRLVRVPVAAVSVGVPMLFVFGLWLVSAAPYGYGFDQAWVIAAIVLFMLANVTGAVGGRREKGKRLLAESLAASGDAPSPVLRAQLREPVGLALSAASFVLSLAVLVLMVWKPGA
jgi:uncharacterized membrane protein